MSLDRQWIAWHMWNTIWPVLIILWLNVKNKWPCFLSLRFKIKKKKWNIILNFSPKKYFNRIWENVWNMSLAMLKPMYIIVYLLSTGVNGFWRTLYFSYSLHLLHCSLSLLFLLSSTLTFSLVLFSYQRAFIFFPWIVWIQHFH